MRWKTRTLGMVVAFCAGMSVSPAFGQAELAKLLPDDGELEDYFGYAVAVSGNTAVIAMPYDDDNGENAGAVYVFQYDGTNWVQQAKLLPDDGTVSDLFGRSVAIEGDTVVVGAPEDDDNGANGGSAYVFRYNDASRNWLQEAKLLAADGVPDNLFGQSVAISGDVALIAVPGVNAHGQYTGSAYVFRRSGSSWSQEAKLVGSDGDEADLFGVGVALDGDIAVVGAPYDDANGRESGSVYVFRHEGASWVEEAKLLASDGVARDFFGWSVAVSGGTIVIGARAGHVDDGTPISGAAYVFQFSDSGWVETAKLLATDGDVYDWFGASVAIDGDACLVGAPHDDDNGESSGSAYVFEYDGAQWVQRLKALPSDGAMWDEFGCSVAVSGNTAVIGALRDDDSAINCGAAYVLYRACPGDLDGDGDVDLSDLGRLLSNYGTESGASYEDGDLDGDGDVDLVDLAALLVNYGTECEWR